MLCVAIMVNIGLQMQTYLKYTHDPVTHKVNIVSLKFVNSEYVHPPPPSKERQKEGMQSGIFKPLVSVNQNFFWL